MVKFWAVPLILVTLFFSTISCYREVRLDRLAQYRVEQLQACRCLNHDGFQMVLPEMTGTYQGEVLAYSNAPEVDFYYFLDLWVNSPPHYEVLTAGGTHYGYAQGEQDGITYAVMLVEKH